VDRDVGVVLGAIHFYFYVNPFLKRLNNYDG
jgi:hypothetical protein